MFFGYKFPFDAARLSALYTTHERYVEQVRASALRLQEQRWLTPEDSKAIVREAEAFRWE
jgi:hypothetical protein